LWLFLFLMAFASAAVDVGNYSIENDYFLFESIRGDINLSIEGENITSQFTFGDQEIGLEEFLRDNGADFSCSPPDCSSGYRGFDEDVEKSLSVVAPESEYIGFVFNGENVVLENIKFVVESDFEGGAQKPLVIEFFEREDWSFGVFSDEFLSKEWGCFNSEIKTVGPNIGTSYYCEMISISESDALMVGADVVGSGDEELQMTVYSEDGFGASWDCNFNPNIEDGCIVYSDLGDFFSAGNYQICVGIDSGSSEYNIYEESEGDNCGFVYEVGPENSVKDYGIFVQGSKYQNAGFFGEIDFGEDVVAAANEFLEEKYDGDCTNDCILPMRVFGVDQNFRILGVDISYKKNYESYSSDKVYDLENIPAEVDFEGVLDLELLGFKALEDGEFLLKLGDDILIEEDINIFPAPIITSVFPLNPPAGIPVAFYVDVESTSGEDISDSNLSNYLTYEWDFGDGEKAETSVSHVIHTYNDLSNYTLSLVVSAGGNMSSNAEFEIMTVSPEAAVEEGLAEKKAILKDLRDVVGSFAEWYGADLISILEIAKFEDELARLSREQNNSFDDEDFRDVALELYALNIPVLVGGDSFEAPFFMTEPGDIDINPVITISGDVSGAESSDYVNSILSWQNDNIDVVVKGRDVFATYSNGENKAILSAYSFEITSKWDRESYLVINRPFSELYFNGNSGARKAGDATVVILDAGETKSLDFYYKDNARGSFFVSPKISSLVIEADIETDCNFNEICEEALGENSDNCRTDCKPTGKAWVLFVLGFLFLLIVYSGLQIWYKKHYEAYLFKDGAQLFNLLMYVTNARARGMDDKQIAAELKSKGWSSERVDYVIRKSIGKTVGMIEIIPIERISAWLRNRQTKKSIEKAREVATRVQGQTNDNINKPRTRI